VSQDVTIIIDGVQHEGTLVNGFVYPGKSKTTYGTAVSSTGKSIKETIWNELDDVMDLMMESGPPTNWRNDPYWPNEDALEPWAEKYQQFGKWQGIAEALCLVICLFEDPVHPNIDSVKGAAVVRWRERQVAAELRGINEEAPDGLDKAQSPVVSSSAQLAVESE
jgi:hypothetical protein